MTTGTGMTRFLWEPDCQEEHDVHEPQPQIPDDPDEDIYCEVCGHDLDQVWVHLFERWDDPSEPAPAQPSEKEWIASAVRGLPTLVLPTGTYVDIEAVLDLVEVADLA